jgi:hypothetical protein
MENFQEHEEMQHLHGVADRGEGFRNKGLTLQKINYFLNVVL